MTSQTPSQKSEYGPLFNPIPEIVLFLVIFIVGTELVLLGGTYGLWGGPEAVAWRVELVEQYGFSDSLFESLFQVGFVSFEKLLRNVSYVFVSEATATTIIGALFVLGAGKYAGDRMTVVTFAIFVLVTVFGGAVGFSFFTDVEEFLTGPLTLAFGLLAFYAFTEAVIAIKIGESFLVAFRLPALILGIDITITLVTGQPPFWVARACAFSVGMLASFFISDIGRFSLFAAKGYLRRK